MSRERLSLPEAVVLLVVITLCVVLVSFSVGVTVVEIIEPTTDTSQAVRVLGHAINTLTGLAVGYLAGRGRNHRKENT